MTTILRNPNSSRSEGGDPNIVIDERKRKRRLSNRESARRSRMRKQKQLKDLNNEINTLQTANKNIIETITIKEEACVKTEAEKQIMRAQTMELTERLQFMSSIVENAKEVSGLSAEIPDPLLTPWPIPHPI
ncbi:hypothetical protein RIF29_38623 [Crotalaria pallida]|uniref:BZIP domain-containing protein n=1 Tax=Crotalaria pallida TaxID=3830 RepID=A0AAN9HP44_CROPI